MEPFSIACTTCQARLRVRDESVIGQILTCPKCGSMVLVEPVAAAAEEDQNVEPAPSQDPASVREAEPSSNAPASAEFESAAKLLDERIEPPSPDLTETVEDLSVEEHPSLETGAAKIAAEQVSTPQDEPVETGEPDDVELSELSPPPRPATDEVLLPNSDWTSEATVQWRNRILTGIAAIVGVALALMLFVVFSGGDESLTSESLVTVSEAVPNVYAEPEDPDEEVIAGATTTLHASEDLPDEGVSNVVPRSVAAEEISDPSVASHLEVPTPEATDSESEPTPLKPEVSVPPSDEPPGLMPKEPTRDEAGGGGESSPLSETLREFGALLNETEESASSMPVVDTELPSSPDETEDEPLARRTGPRVVELDDRLHDPVAQIEFDGVPLSNFLRFVSDYSTIPITLDADILRWARVSPNTPIKLKASDTTVAEILDRGLAPLGLEYRSEENQLFITRRPRDASGMRTVTFKVEDLVGDDPKQLQWLGAQIMDFVEPDSWSSRGGIGTITFRGNELVIEQKEMVQFAILEFCEKLRVARGLNKLSPYEASMFRLETRAQRAQAKLVHPIKLTYIRPAPLERIVDRIAKAAKLHVLIDWRALATVEWSPDAEVRFSVADQPVAKALATLLEPMDLVYRVVDESTLQVTTPAVLESRLEVEFYRVAKLSDDGTKFVESAREALGKTNFRDLGGSGQLVFDEASNCLIACLGQTGQMELQAWLDARAEAATSSTSFEATTPTSAAESRTVPASDRVSND